MIYITNTDSLNDLERSELISLAQEWARTTSSAHYGQRLVTKLVAEIKRLQLECEAYDNALSDTERERDQGLSALALLQELTALIMERK